MRHQATARKPPARVAESSLNAPQVLAWLAANPSFFIDHAGALGTLAQPARGGNILSLHALKEKRTAHAAEKLKTRHRQVVAAAANNALTAQTLLGQVAAAAGCNTMGAFRTWVQTGLKQALEVDAARLLTVAPTASATAIDAATFTELCPELVNLRSLPDAASRAHYGAKGKTLASECALVLPTTQGQPLAVLLLASTRATRFHAGQETTLAALFARALGAMLARLG